MATIIFKNKGEVFGGLNLGGNLRDLVASTQDKSASLRWTRLRSLQILIDNSCRLTGLFSDLRACVTSSSRFTSTSVLSSRFRPTPRALPHSRQPAAVHQAAPTARLLQRRVRGATSGADRGARTGAMRLVCGPALPIETHSGAHLAVFAVPRPT